jgi:hypothetical protein
MQLEIRKETKPDGDMFFYVYKDTTFIKSYWIGNYLTGEKGTYDGKVGEEAALAKAKEMYDKVKANYLTEPIVEIIQSETI